MVGGHDDRGLGQQEAADVVDDALEREGEAQRLDPAGGRRRHASDRHRADDGGGREHAPVRQVGLAAVDLMSGRADGGQEREQSLAYERGEIAVRALADESEAEEREQPGAGERERARLEVVDELAQVA